MGAGSKETASRAVLRLIRRQCSIPCESSRVAVGPDRTDRFIVARHINRLCYCYSEGLETVCVT